MRPDGTVDLVGRADRQVKIRGHRVEPSSVEEALRACPGVAEAVVLPVREGAQTQLVAYLRPDGASSPDVSELRRRLVVSLPAAAVPARMAYVATFPMTPNGKVDTRRLPDVATLRPAISTAYAPPESPAQESLAVLVGDVLRLDRVGVDDDVMELGADSLQMVEMATRIEEELDVEITVGDIFDTPTVRGLAVLVDEVRA
jgi:acyl carrier protein